MTMEIAIIGAGLAGLSLALCLNDQGIKCVVYESYEAPRSISGAVMLSPNALKILDYLGLYDDVRSKGYNFDTLYFRTASGELIETYEFGSQAKYGYRGLRVYRYQLIDTLLKSIHTKGIPLRFGHKFSHITKETDDEVTWQFADGSTSTASLLIGADGIHSKVRRYMFPDVVPKFTGLAGISAAVPTSQVTLPSPDYQLPVTIVSPGAGAFVIAPQQSDGSEILIGKLKRMSDRTREEWDIIHADKESSIAFLQENTLAFGEIAVSAASKIPSDKINVWPFYVIPKLDRWTSERRRVILVGDSAHAVPPSAGQGINQAFEDVFMLSLLFGKGRDGPDDLDFWQRRRQERVEMVLELNAQIDQRRLPGLPNAEQTKEDFDLDWLYGVDIQKEVDDWVTGKADR